MQQLKRGSTPSTDLKTANEHRPSLIGTRNESTIHAQLKEMYRCPGARTEAPHGTYLVDVDRGDGELVEIQTRHFGTIKNKLLFLLASHRVRLVYPLLTEKVFVFIDPETGREKRRRKSSRGKTLFDLTDELVGIAPLLSHPRLLLEVLFTSEEEVRCRDGKGSWRRKGMSIVDRKLIAVTGSLRLQTAADYLKVFLPDGAPREFTNRSLAEYLDAPYRKAQQLTYCLRAIGVVETAGKKGREIVYRLNRKTDPGERKESTP
ncbi:MAG: hypothetical protein JXD23_06815 [Spirochaetales bacterium]|nr:hypothetical protein [Spirochaetales bacterium]